MTDPATQRVIESREVVKGQITAAVELAGTQEAKVLAEVSAKAAVASAIVYLGDVILFGFTPREES